MRRFLFSTIFCLLVSGGPVHAEQFKALLFTKTLGWHHKSLNAGVTAMQKLAALHDFGLEWHEDATRFSDDNLAQFDVIIFLSTTGDILNAEQQMAMEKFIRSGKGFVGIHSAADTEYGWPWYQKLVGRTFRIHPEVQTAKLKVENRSFPGLETMPDVFLWTDEWYDFGGENVDGLTYLLSVDESTYDVEAYWGGPARGKGMGDFHPIAWHHRFEGGRSFYTALGHLSASYEDTMLLSHIYGGIYWAATGKGLGN